MIGGTINKIVNTQFKWSGVNEGRAGLGGLASGAAAVAAAAVAAVGALWRLADQTTKIYGEFYDLSQRTGIAASQLHAMSIAAEQDGVALDGITTALRRMPSVLQDLERGTATAQQTFDTLGLTLEDLQGLSIEEQFYKIGGALAAIEDESTRAAIATDVFGRSGMNLLPFLERGEAGMRELSVAARESGAVLGEDAYEAADAFQDKLVEMKAKMQGVLMDAIQPLLPDLLEMAETLAETGAEILPEVIEAAGTLIPVVQALGEAVGLALEGWIQLLGPAMEGWQDLLALMQSTEEIAARIGAGVHNVPTVTPEEWAARMAEKAARIEQYGSIEAWMAAGGGNVLGGDDEETTTPSFGGAGGGGPTPEELADKKAHWIEMAQETADALTAIEQAAADKRAAILHDRAEDERAVAAELAAAEQAELDARAEQMAVFADYTTQLLGNAWDVMFSDTRQGFDDMLKDMLMDLAKSGLLKLVKGAITGGPLGFFL